MNDPSKAFFKAKEHALKKTHTTGQQRRMNRQIEADSLRKVSRRSHALK